MPGFIGRLYGYNKFKLRPRVTNIRLGGRNGAEPMDVDPQGGSGPPRGRIPTLRYRNSRRGRRRTLRRRVTKRRVRKSKKTYLTPHGHAKKGVVLVYESSAITGTANDDSEVAYVGHCNAPIGNMLAMAVRAIVKSAFARMGIHMRSFDDQIGFAGTARISYYQTPTTTTLTNIDFAFVATSTYNNAVGTLLSGLTTALAAHTDLKPYLFNIIPTGGITRTFYLDATKMTFSCMSRLKIQNRTPNGSNDASVDTNNVNFLIGQQYWGSGTGTYVKSLTLGVPHQPLIGESQAGLILQTRADNFTSPNVWMRHPPETTKLFTNVRKRAPVTKFMPGATKYSLLKTNRTISFTALLDMYLKDASNSYVLSSMGQFSIFGFQKYIDDDIGVKVTLAYEAELQIGVTASLSSNVHTTPVLFEV